jgi:hypothetical protein
MVVINKKGRTITGTPFLFKLSIINKRRIITELQEVRDNIQHKYITEQNTIQTLDSIINEMERETVEDEAREGEKTLIED